MPDTHPSAAAYDATPYPRLAHRTTQPDQMAALGTLLGLAPAPPGSARVLELGCAAGSNLLPMALLAPGASFTGIDISPRQIERARADAAALGIANARFETLDLAALAGPMAPLAGPIAPLAGPYDYIIAHGLYSWIDAPARDALLRAISALLAPQGIAYVSYNTYPGWHSLDAMRRMMLYHTRGITHPAERARRATALLDLLAAALPPERSPHGALIHGFREYLLHDFESLAEERDAYLLHDHLEQDNFPVYFHEFAEHAGDHHLQYLCDAELPSDFAQGFPDGVAEQIGQVAASLVELQQYMDFARYRMFRRSLLVHADVEITRALRPDRLTSLYFASPAVPESPEPKLSTVTIERFRSRKGISLTIDHPLSKAAFLTLVRRWPEALRFDELIRAAAGLLRAESPDGMIPLSDQDAGQVALTLLRGLTSSEELVEIGVMAPQLVTVPGPRPVGFRWARHQLATEGLLVTNMRHERVRLEPLEGEVLRLCDGAHDHAAMLAALEPPVRRGEIVFEKEGAPVADKDEAAAMLPAAVTARLRTLARASLLES